MDGYSKDNNISNFTTWWVWKSSTVDLRYWLAVAEGVWNLETTFISTSKVVMPLQLLMGVLQLVKGRVQ